MNQHNPQSIIGSSEEDVRIQALSWWMSWGQNWDRTLDLLTENRNNPKNEELLEGLVRLYERVDKAVEGNCSRRGVCCVDDVYTTFLEYLHFMTPFSPIDLDNLYTKPHIINSTQSRRQYEGMCVFLDKEDAGTLCFAYDYRPLRCRVLVPQGDCHCQLLSDRTQYESELKELAGQMDIPKEFQFKLATLTRDWPELIQKYLMTKAD